MSLLVALACPFLNCVWIIGDIEALVILQMDGHEQQVEILAV